MTAFSGSSKNGVSFAAPSKPEPSQKKNWIGSKNTWNRFLKSQNHADLFLKLVMRTLESLFSADYCAFDAHTTSNCCHGIALITLEIIEQLKHPNYSNQLMLLRKKIQCLSDSKKIPSCSDLVKLIPQGLLDLCSLYTLTFTKEIHPDRGRLTKPSNLQKISPVSVNFCNRLIHALQKLLSNVAVGAFKDFLGVAVRGGIKTCGIPVNYWGQYVSEQYIRIDKNGINYSSCLYSMQIALAYLISKRGKIGIVNDNVMEGSNEKKRIVHFLIGDQKGSFKLLTKSDYIDRNHDPVVVFGGCSITSDQRLTYMHRMTPWIYNFPSLVLACDIHYPQFPENRGDPEFDSTPIVPEEEVLKNAIFQHSNIGGASYKDPSLFCLTHIYIASASHLFQVKNETNTEALPDYFIPHEAIQEKN